MELHYHVRALLKQRPELYGILGRELLTSLGDAKVEKIDAELLTRYSTGETRYILISEYVGRSIVVGQGFKLAVQKIFLGRTERILDAFNRIGKQQCAYIRYVVGILEEEEEEGFVLLPKRMVIYDPPKLQEFLTMPQLIKHLAGTAREIIRHA